MTTYICKRCKGRSFQTCTILLTGDDCLPVTCPFVPEDRPMVHEARWERAADTSEAAKTNIQQLKHAIALAKESISIVEQHACV